VSDASLPLADELAAVFARMSGLLLSDETVASALDLVAALAAETISGSIGAGISLMDEAGGRTTAAATGPVVERADTAQYELGEGPCLTAWAQRMAVRVDDIAADGRWPSWAKVAAGLGLGASLSMPMLASGPALGAIKVYAPHPDVYSPGAERLLRMFAGQAAMLVANLRSHEAARRVSDQMRDAMAGRDVINQAKGYLMARDSVDEHGALAALIGISLQDGRSLADAARDLLSARRRR
jgi:GAF domain-containing protein